MSNDVIKTTNNNVDQVNLELSPLYANGYGVIPKSAMHDPKLTIQAKGIFAYFCSFTGRGNTAFPSISRILNDLCISRPIYYNHFKLLKEYDYITVTQEKTPRFLHNVYNIDYARVLTNTFSLNQEEGQGGVVETYGYGIIPRSTMIDTRLDLKAKAIHAYFRSYAGRGNEAYPTLKNILYHLDINQGTYYKYINNLVQLYYLTTERIYEDGKHSRTIYHLIEDPEAQEALLIKNLTTVNDELLIKNFTTESDDLLVKNMTTENNNLLAKNFTTVNDELLTKNLTAENNELLIKNFTSESHDLLVKNLSTENLSAENLPTENFTTINNSINNNSDSNINLSINNKREELDGLMEQEKISQILFYLKSSQSLPLLYERTTGFVTTAIHILTDYDNTINQKTVDEDESLELAAFKLFNNALIDMLQIKKPITLAKRMVGANDVSDKLNEYIEYEKKNDKYSITSLMEVSVKDYINACTTTEIKNHLRYMMACIWNAMQIGKSSILAQAVKSKEAKIPNISPELQRQIDRGEISHRTLQSIKDGTYWEEENLFELAQRKQREREEKENQINKRESGN